MEDRHAANVVINGRKMIKTIFIILELIMLIILSIEDIAHKKISVRMTYASIIAALSCAAYGIIIQKDPAANVVWALVPGAIMLGLAFISGEKLGYGDGIVMMTVGLVFGAYSAISAAIIALFFSTIVSVILLVIRHANRNTRLPFIPCITAAVGVMVLGSFG